MVLTRRLPHPPRRLRVFLGFPRSAGSTARSSTSGLVDGCAPAFFHTVPAARAFLDLATGTTRLATGEGSYLLALTWRRRHG
jgi:hypothetical protein